MEADLTDAEIDGICAPLKQSAAKVRYLKSLGLTVRKKPNGRPLVNRQHYNAVMSAAANESTFGAGPVWGVH